MAQEIIYANGSKEISVPASQYVAIAALEGTAKIYLGTATPNFPISFTFSQEIENEQVLLGTYTGVKAIKIDAGPGKVFYNIGAAPQITIPAPELAKVSQGSATAKTVSATLTAAEILAGIITLNQGATAATAQQLPLATAMDTALPGFGAEDSFDFSVINISTDAGEDGSITTNTGWTLVGNMDIASNAAATDKSAGRFRAAKTATGAWTLFRLS